MSPAFCEPLIRCDDPELTSFNEKEIAKWIAVKDKSEGRRRKEKAYQKSASDKHYKRGIYE